MRFYKVASILALAAAASACSKPSPSLEEVRTALPELTNIESVTPTPIKGVYQVLSQSNVVYISGDLQYVISGHILNVVTKESLTDPVVRKLQERDALREAQAIDEIQKNLPDLLIQNQKNFIKEVRGDGREVLYMVTDIRCGFCREMEKTLEKLTNVTIYRIPVAFLGSDSVRLAGHAWCNKDPVQSWKDITEGKNIPAGDVACEAPTVKNTELMNSWRVTGTPTLFRADGQRWARGLLNVEDTKYFMANGTQALLTKKEGR